MELQDFVQKTEESITLGELAVPREEANASSTLSNKASGHLAAQVAMINDPEVLLDNFRVTKNELSNLGVVRKHTELWENALGRARAVDQQALSEVVGDETLDLDLRANAITVSTLPAPVEPKSDRTILSESLIVGNDPTTTSGEDILSNIFSNIDRMNAQKREDQKLINSQFLTEDQNLGSTVVDLVELIVPFAELVDAQMLLRDLGGAGTYNPFLGDIKRKLGRLQAAVPLEDRNKWNKLVIQIVNENSQIIFPDGNDLSKINFLNQIIMGEEYSDTAFWFDNIFSVIDMSGVGLLVKNALRAKRLSGLVKDAEQALQPLDGLTPEMVKAADVTPKAAIVRGEASPTSVARNASDTNPEVARAIHETVAEGSEEAADALYGTTRAEALGDDLLPQTDVGKIGNRVEQEGASPQFQPNARVVSFSDELDGGTRFFKEEKAQMVSRIKENIFSSISVLNRTAMNFIRGDVAQVGGGFRVSSVYGPREGGFVNPQDAVDAIKLQFKDYGIGDDAITLLVREGGGYVPTTLAEEAAKKAMADVARARKKRIPDEFRPAKDYLVSLDFKHDYDVQGITDFSKPDVKFNWLDRFNIGGRSKVGMGSLQQHVLDAHSTLHPQLTNSANAAVDRVAAFQKALVSTGKGFADRYSKLSKESRARLDTYIQKSNFEGIRFNPLQLKASGFSQDEVEAVWAWRQHQDTQWWVNNHDLGKTLSNRGYGVFVGSDGTTELYVKPVLRVNVGNSVKTYDSSSDTIVTLSKAELDELYEGGGEISKLRTTMNVGDDVVDFVTNPNTVKSGYIRSLTSNDKVLAYRDGYFPVMYDGKEFIYKTIKGSNGADKIVYIATARNSRDAADMVKRLGIEFPDSRFGHNTDRKASARDISDSGEAEWQVVVNSGLSAQKRRGERLVDASADSQAIVGSNLVDPVEAITASIRSMARKVNMRKWFESTKTRFINQYADVLPTKQGKAIWPATRSEITGSSGLSADARTTFDWVNGLENGYYNLIDESWKAVVNSVAEIAGAKAAKGSKAGAKVEEWAWAFKNVAPTRVLKGLAFKAYLAANPLRQIVIQSHQAIQLNALDPIYTTFKMPQEVAKLVLGLRGFSKSDEVVEMVRAFRNSGLLEAVDTNNLIRADLSRLADVSVTEKALSSARFPMRLAQRVGFDTGEQFNVMTAWLFFRNRALKRGKTLNAETYEEILGEARNFTFNMNAAGDMPYNQNSLSMITQFLQVPHKAFTQIFFNRSLTRWERARVATFSTLMYGVPTATLGFLFENMEPGPTRDILERGMETMALNQLIESTTGIDTRIDFGDLAPNNMAGLSDFLVRLWTTDAGDMLARSPSGALFLGPNPRLTEMFKTSVRFFSENDYDDPVLQTNLGDMFLAGANVFSGYSNAFKATYAFETGTKMSSTGRLSDAKVTTTEAIAQAFGFRTIDEVAMQDASNRFYNAKYGPDSGSGNFTTKDVSDWYGELKRHLARRGKNIRDDDYFERVLRTGLIVFQRDGPKFQQTLYNMMVKDFSTGDMSLITNMYKTMDLIDPKELNTVIELLPEGSEKDLMRDAFSVFRELDEVRIRRLEDG